MSHFEKGDEFLKNPDKNLKAVHWDSEKSIGVDKSPENDHEIKDDDLMREESEHRWEEKKGVAFIPENEIVDPATEDMEDLILENIDNEAVQEEIEGGEESKKFNETGEYTSSKKNFLPYEIFKIKKKYSLPREQWSKLSEEERQVRKDKAQEEINNLYVTDTVYTEKKDVA